MEKEFDIEILRDDSGAYCAVANRDGEALTDLGAHVTIEACLDSAWGLLKRKYYPSEGQERASKPAGKRQELVPYFLAKLANCTPLWANRTIKTSTTMGSPMTFDIEVVCVEMDGVHLLVTAPNRGRRYTVEVLFSDVNDKAPELILQNAVDIFLAKTRWGQAPRGNQEGAKR